MLPVALVVLAGYIAGKRVIDAAGIKALADLAFFLFLPALLFRSMATAEFERSDAALLAVYFGTSVVWFFIVSLSARRFARQMTDGAIVLGLAAVYSNTVQLGIPVQKLAFGESGLRLQLAIISLQSLVLLITATIWLEAYRARQARAAGTAQPGMARTVFELVRSAVIHPVILPILLGLAWNASDLPLPAWSQQPLGFLASAAGPLLLVLMGAQLSRMQLSTHLYPGLLLCIAKNMLHPLAVALVCWLVDLPPLPSAVAIVCAALPMGVNVFLFSQRYRVNEELTTAAIALSSLASLLSVTVALALVPRV